jgi:hypothetical protein
VEVFCHGNADVRVEDVAGVAVVAEDEIGGDGPMRNADAGAGGPGEIERGGDLSEEGLGEAVAGEDELAGDLEAAAGDGRAWVERVEMGSFGMGLEERREMQRHGVRVCRREGRGKREEGEGKRD